MNQLQNYSIEDIEKFLEINKMANEEPQSKSLHKLLSIQSKISIFKDIDPLELKAIVYDLKFVKFHFKDYVIKQNDIRREIFFIISGECQVLHNNKKVGQLRPGEVFGEAGAIFETKRNASVICSSDEATLLSFCIDGDNMEFCASALALLYKNLAFEINNKLENVNSLLG